MRLLVQALLILSLTVPAMGRTITFDDLYSIPVYADPQVSPDGRRIVFVLRTSDPVANTRASHLWVIDGDGSGARQLTHTDGSGAWHPRWTPDGAALLFLANRGDRSQVWRLPMDGGEAQPLTALATGVSGFIQSTAGGVLICASSVFPDCDTDSCNEARLDSIRDNPDRPRLYERLFARRYNRWDDGRVNRLFVVEAACGAARPLYVSPYDIPSSHLGGNRDFALSPNGREVVFSMSRDTMPAVLVNNDLFSVPLSGGSPEVLVAGPGQEVTPRFSPDGRYLACLATARAAYESDQRDLMIRDVRKGNAVNLTKNFDRSIGSYVWGPRSRYIYFTAIEHGRNKVWRADVRKQTITLLMGDAVCNNLAVSPDGRFLVVGRSASDTPYELYRYDLKSGRLTRLTHLTDSVIADLDFGRSEEFWFTGANGDSVHGWLTLPPGFDAARRYPLTLLIHGGPQWCWLGDFNYYGWNTQLLAAQGYVVAQIDPHGSIGYGLAFKEYVSGRWGRGDFDDLMRGVDYLLDHHAFIDPDRMAALGRSYGGFMANWICGHTGRFRCLVSIDGTSNHVSFYGSTDELWFPEWDIGGTPWDNTEEYLRSSPIHYAADFKTPMLLIHGQRDYRVDVSEGLQMFTALQRQGVPSQFLYYPGEGHSVHGLKNLRDVYEKQLAWLKRWLAPD